MMSPEALAQIATVASLFAAAAAWWSAGTAKAALKQSAEAERKRQFGLVVSAAQRVKADASRATDLAQRLKQEYKDLFSFAGMSGSGQLQELLDEVEKVEEVVSSISESSTEWLQNERPRGDDISDKELADLLYRFTDNLGQLHIAKERFREDMATAEKQNHAYREREFNRSS